MLALELEELKKLIEAEEDKKLRTMMLTVLCVADRLAEHTSQLKVIDEKYDVCEIFTGKSEITCKIISGLGAILFATLVGLGAYIFKELNLIGYRQSGMLTSLEYIKEDNALVASKLVAIDSVLVDNKNTLKSIEIRNAAVDFERTKERNEHKFLP
jgi:hypothetical protein